ncbi:MAG: hypothetical protein H0V64_13575 [Geodermatophilaceae bacterium]|nr:hypothetical protein [Geodermatophilaceae bacterium]MDQ3464838.1 hypothetical protein [Actinomycetota bacterium]
MSAEVWLKKVKFLLVLLVGLLPAAPIKNRLLTMLGHQIHPTAKIDPIILYKVLRIEIGARTHIWSGNLFKNLRGIRIGADGTMMRWNRVTAIPSFRRTGGADPETVGILSLGDQVLVTKGHALDCSGGFIMADWSAIAGRETLVYSHSYDPSTHELACAPTRIGVNAFIAARTTVAAGATLPDRSVLAMGGVLMPGATKTDTLYGGVPAKPVRDISDWKMMSDRTVQRPPIQA